MSGVCGIWHRDGRPVDPAELARMSSAIRHRGPDGERRWISGDAGFAFQALNVTPESATATQPWVSASGVVVLLDGRLDDRDQLRQSLADLEPDAPDCEFIARAYQLWGGEAFARLAGDFAIALFDPAGRKLFLARDRMGTRPLYYCVAGQTVLFASEIKAILAHPDSPLRPNDDALADFLMPGDAHCSELTFFDQVFRVVPGNIFEATPANAAQRRSWDFDLAAEVRYARAEEYAEHLRELMFRAVERRARSSFPSAISVSGGLDSSGIYCILDRLPGAPRLLPLHIQYAEFEESSEEDYVRELEAALGRPIVRQPAINGFMENVESSIWHTEAPATTSQGNLVRRQCAFAAQQGARLFFHGQFGDYLLSPTGYWIDLFVNLRWGTLRRHLHTTQAWMQDVSPAYLSRLQRTMIARALTPNLLLPVVRTLRRRNDPRYPLWFAPAFRHRAMQRAKWQAPLAGRFRSHHAQWLYRSATWPRFFHSQEVANKNLAQFGLEDAAPLLDRDLVAFMMAIPGDIVSLNGVPKGLYREAMRGILPEKIRLRHNKADFARFNNRGAEQELVAIRSHLHPDCLGVQMSYLDRSALREAIARTAGQYDDRQTAEPARRLNALIGLELWLETFFGRPRSQIARPPQQQTEFAHTR